jgi:prolyl-tRNA synthetase
VYAQWIRSHRDLPLKLNQWCNVVRWEFKHPTPFIRSREFLWQEGHTAFATKAEADAEVRAILDRYKQVYEQLLAVPVIQGVKSEKEKFAGGLYTTTVEAFVPATGRGIQAATSHCLGQNFAKMFGIEFENADGGRSMVWQNSWGLTTRSIGVAVMVHGDDTGLVLPPRVAPVQVIIVPIPNAKLSAEERAALLAGAAAAGDALTAAGVRVKVDPRDNYTPGWKYNHWELKGVPLRMEFGPRDLAAGVCVLARRDTRDKATVPLADLPAQAKQLLEAMQADMLARATAERNSRISTILAWKDFVPALDAKNMVLAPWCEDPESEEWVKRKSGEESDRGAAKTLCIPFEQPPLPPNTPCFTGNGKVATCWALWGRSY